MKHFKLLFIVLLLSFISGSIFAQNLGTINITPIRFEQQGDFLNIEIDFKLNNAEIRSSISVDFIPILLSDHRIKELPKLSLKGKRNYKSYIRSFALNKEDAIRENYYDVVRLNNPTNMIISYKIAVPYESWMDQAHLDLEKYVSFRRQEELISVRTIFNKREYAQSTSDEYNIITFTGYIVPEIEVIKKRTISMETNLYFQVGSSKLESYYKSNPERLEEIGEMINDIYFDRNTSITGLSLTGFASPEGTLAINRYLSNARAKTLQSYLMLRYSIPKNQYHIHYGGENWDGLKKMVEASKMKCKSEILTILNNIKKDSERKKILKELEAGAPFRYMLKYMYPELRKVIVKIDYQIMPFTLYQAQYIITQRPGDLSLNEMYLVANSYEGGTAEYYNIFEIAYNTYPDQEVAILNMANTALLQRNIEDAEKYLNMVVPTEYIPEYLNLRGVLEIFKGNFNEAEKYFELSLIQSGVDASLNLIELKNIGY